MTFDPTKPVQTCAGRKTKIVSTKLIGAQPIMALITLKAGEVAYTYYTDGCYSRGRTPNDRDLVNIPEKGYINIWQTEDGSLSCSSNYFSTKEAALEALNLSGQPKVLFKALEMDLPLKT